MSQAFDAVVLLAHGARDARWLLPFRELRRVVAAKAAPARVSLAFAEYATPTLQDVVRDLCDAGARRLLVVPVFLAGGGHVAKDIPALVAAERARHAGVDIAVSGAIGEEPEVVQAMVEAVTRLARGGG
jgi:sirohydrochlorin cobaltochelatase